MSDLRRRVLLTASIVGVLVVVAVARGFDFEGGALVLGLFTGLTYGLLAVGLVIVYRSSGFINFAHGDIGFLSAAVLITLVTSFGWPYWFALPAAMAAGAGVGALTEVTVVRRLRHAPRLMSMIATLLLGQFLLGAGAVMNERAFTGFLYPQPAGLPQVRIGAQLATAAHMGMLILTPILVVGVVLFMRRTRFGLGIRAAAANPDAAALAGMLPARMATAAWALGGSIAAFTAILWLPTRGLAVGQFGPSLLVRALAAAVIGRMESLPTAFAAGAGLGVLEQLVLFNTRGGGEIEAWLFGIILVTLLVRSRRQPRREDEGGWSAVLPWPALPAAVARLRSVRLTGWGLAALALVGSVAAIAFLDAEQAFVIEGAIAFALVGVSIGIVSGFAGQLSLGQFAVAGIGAVLAYRVALELGSFPLAVIAGAIAGAFASVLIGLPALRLRGLLLAVTTLSFAVASHSWLLSQGWAFGGGVSVPDVALGGLRITTNRSYWPVAIALLVLGMWLARNVRASAFGRTLIALRDNEDAARAFTIGATRRKIQAFAVSGAIAGLGGVIFAFTQQNLDAGSFASVDSIEVVAAAVIGGIAVLAGPVVGALYFIAVPGLMKFGVAGQATHVLGALALILAFPNGLAGALRPVRERVVAWLAARAGLDLGDDAEPRARPVRLDAPPAPAEAGPPLLEVETVSKRYGGLVAVDGVSLTVRAGETVGLIGPNGAGKTTLFEIIGGFVAPDGGAIRFAGGDVTRLGPEARGRLGLVRSFQEAQLFPTMTLLDTVRVAHERLLPSSVWRAAIGRDPREAERERRARELIALMGLDAFRDKQIGELSTGTRRIAELTCILALEPRLLLLDEPAAGVAQRETEQLGAVLDGVKRHLGTTLIVIEHDIPLLSSIADRFVAMESGRVIAEGTPAEVQADPAVVDAFLGGSLEAIARSGEVGVGGTR